MGNCINKNTVAETDLFSCCNNTSSAEFKKSEILCGKEQIDYYLNHKITDLVIDFAKRTITDNSNNTLKKEISVPENYFKLLEYYAKSYESRQTENPDFLVTSHLKEPLPYPVWVEEERLEKLNIIEYPNIANTVHPVISKPISEIDIRNENLIFNDLIQEAYISKNEKLENLIKKFLLSPNNTHENLIQNLIKIYTHEDGIFHNVNKVLREDLKNTFLGSVILALNNAIRTNFANLRYEFKCFRKANLTQEEFDQYIDILNSKTKTLNWKSIVSATKNIDSDIKNNINSSIYENIDYNTIFSIEFSSDSWGLDISHISLSKFDDEILLPANSIFEITNIQKNPKDQIIYINLVKLDKNIKAVRSANVQKKSIIKETTIFEKEISLLKNDVDKGNNSNKFSFITEQNDSSTIKFALIGPAKTPYAGGIFQVNVYIPEGYPNKSPIIKFATKIYHPNISFESGDLDCEILDKIWRPSLSIAKLIGIIYNLLIEPNKNYENVDTPPKKEYIEDLQTFIFNATDFTRRFAIFEDKINGFMRDSKLTELEVRNELLKTNAFETII